MFLRLLAERDPQYAAHIPYETNAAQLSADDPSLVAVRRLFDTHVAQITPSGPRPCMFRGEDLTHAEREALGVGHRKRYALCLNPDHGEYQKPVCPCTGCGTKCPSYVASKLGAD